MDESLIVLLAVNLICVVIYAIVKAVRKEGAGVVVFFIFLPVFGFALYFLPCLTGRIFGEREYDKNIRVRKGMRRRHEKNTCESTDESVSGKTSL